MADDGAERAGRLRLELLRALELAMRRHAEVLRVIAASDDRSDAEARVQQLLGLDQVQASAVLSLSWGRLTKQGFAEIAEQIAAQSAAPERI